MHHCLSASHYESYACLLLSGTTQCLRLVGKEAARKKKSKKSACDRSRIRTCIGDRFLLIGCHYLIVFHVSLADWHQLSNLTPYFFNSVLCGCTWVWHVMCGCGCGRHAHKHTLSYHIPLTQSKLQFVYPVITLMSVIAPAAV